MIMIIGTDRVTFPRSISRVASVNFCLVLEKHNFKKFSFFVILVFKR